MKLFKINDKITLSGEVYNNSQAWGHEVKCFYYDREIAKKRVRYYNRTWERYQFESAFYSLVDQLDKEKEIPTLERIEIYKWIKNR